MLWNRSVPVFTCFHSCKGFWGRWCVWNHDAAGPTLFLRHDELAIRMIFICMSRYWLCLWLILLPAAVWFVSWGTGVRHPTWRKSSELRENGRHGEWREASSYKLHLRPGLQLHICTAAALRPRLRLLQPRLPPDLLPVCPAVPDLPLSVR